MATKAKRHTHKYYRAWNGEEYLWVCGLPRCSHHMPKHYEFTLNGKETLCWNYDRDGFQDCEKTTILDERTMKMNKPICATCDSEAIAVATMDNDTIEKLKELGILGKLD